MGLNGRNLTLNQMPCFHKTGAGLVKPFLLSMCSSGRRQLFHAAGVVFVRLLTCWGMCPRGDSALSGGVGGTTSEIGRMRGIPLDKTLSSTQPRNIAGCCCM